MKVEREMVWLMQIVMSPYCGSILKKPIPGCKKDFERLLDAPENDKQFRLWIDNLIKEEILVVAGKFYRGNNFSKKVLCYTVNYRLALNKLRKNPMYVLANDFISNQKLVAIG